MSSIIGEILIQPDETVKVISDKTGYLLIENPKKKKWKLLMLALEEKKD